MIEPQDLLVGTVAMGLAVGSILGVFSPDFLSSRWSIAKFVEMRWGALAVRLLFVLLATIMLIVAYQLLIVHRR